MSQRFLVIARLPHAGLGNMLLVWARALAFAEINSLPIQRPNWKGLHIGPWIRGEKCKRYYGSFFLRGQYQSPLYSFFSGLKYKPRFYRNPSIEKVNLNLLEKHYPNQRHVFVFDELPPWNDYFKDLKSSQPLVKQKLYEYIKPSLLQSILSKPSPEIAIHIRRGDYQKPHKGDDFAVRRYVYTPLGWYIDTLSKIRCVVDSNIPATIFSDGYEDELSEILELPNVSLSPETSALSDLLSMSRSKLLIASCHSSFSSWASYLGQCPTIWQAGRFDLYEPIFSQQVRDHIYEGGFDPLCENIPMLLQKNVKDLWPSLSQRALHT